jgi:transposase
LEAYTVTRALRFEAGQDGERPRVWIDLAPIGGRPMTCDGCGRRAVEVHDVSERMIRDLPLFDAETFLRVPRRRVRCHGCGLILPRFGGHPG